MIVTGKECWSVGKGRGKVLPGLGGWEGSSRRRRGIGVEERRSRATQGFPPPRRNDKNPGSADHLVKFVTKLLFLTHTDTQKVKNKKVHCEAGAIVGLLPPGAKTSWDPPIMEKRHRCRASRLWKEGQVTRAGDSREATLEWGL